MPAFYDGTKGMSIPKIPPVGERLDRPRYERTPPRQVPGAELMDALVGAAKRRGLRRATARPAQPHPGGRT